MRRIFPYMELTAALLATVLSAIFVIILADFALTTAIVLLLAISVVAFVPSDTDLQPLLIGVGVTALTAALFAAPAQTVVILALPSSALSFRYALLRVRDARRPHPAK